MAKYHINAKGEPGSCRAKKDNCPFGSIDSHYEDKESARQGYETQQKMREMITSGKTKKHPLTTKALKSKLVYSGVTPEWLKDEITLSETVYKTKPEVIDVVDSAEGKFAVVWNPNSLRRGDMSIQNIRGLDFSTLQYRDFETGEVKGFAQVKYANRDSIERAFGKDEYSSFRFLQGSLNKDIGLKANYDFIPGKDLKLNPSHLSASTEEERIDLKKKLWLNAHVALEEIPESVASKDGKDVKFYHLKESLAPTDEKSLDEDLKKLNEKSDSYVENYLVSLKAPIIDYSQIDESLRGKGLGTSMYVYAARKLAEKDLPLASSSIQSDEAQSLWSRMTSDERLPINMFTTRFLGDGYSKNVERFSLDFRKK